MLNQNSWQSDHTCFNSRPQSSTSHRGGICRVAILYDDRLAGLAAMKLHTSIARGLGKSVRLTCELWRLNLLHNFLLGEAAAESAANAQVIIFSARSDFSMSSVFENWMDRWLDWRTDNDAALIALLEPALCSRNSDPNLRGYLEKRAQQEGMSFFAPDQPDAGGAYSPWTSLSNSLPQSSRAVGMKSFMPQATNDRGDRQGATA